MYHGVPHSSPFQNVMAGMLLCHEPYSVARYDLVSDDCQFNMNMQLPAASIYDMFQGLYLFKTIFKFLHVQF